MLELKNIGKTFNPGTVNEKVALQGVDLHLAQGDFATIVGSNGAGKSTLFNAIAGEFIADTGTITLDGKDITFLPDFKRSKAIGRMFQDPLRGTAPHMSIEENLAMALERGQRRALKLGVTKAKRERFAEELTALEQGLDTRLKDWVSLLSGGQRQALSLLMATFSEPKILLLDEHTAALDPQRAALVSRLTTEVVDRFGLTTLMVTHNMEQALRMGTRLIMMHEGGIVLDLDQARKDRMTVQDLLREFGRVKGSALDDTLLQ